MSLCLGPRPTGSTPAGRRRLLTLTPGRASPAPGGQRSGASSLRAGEAGVCWGVLGPRGLHSAPAPPPRPRAVRSRPAAPPPWPGWCARLRWGSPGRGREVRGGAPGRGRGPGPEAYLQQPHVHREVSRQQALPDQAAGGGGSGGGSGGWVRGRRRPADTHISMAQHTRMRKWKRSGSEKSVSQMRMTSGSRNSWDSSSVSQRKVKY